MSFYLRVNRRYSSYTNLVRLTDPTFTNREWEFDGCVNWYCGDYELFTSQCLSMRNRETELWHVVGKRSAHLARPNQLITSV